MNNRVRISVIIPNLHSPIIDQTIQSVLGQQTDHALEIIVVGMDKYELINNFADQVKFIETEKPTLPGIARNIGVRHAKGDYFFFIDSDCVANPGWIEQHLSIHENRQAAVIVGGGINFPSENYFTLTDNVSSFHEFMTHMPLGEREYLPTLNLSLSRPAWETIGEFKDYPASEDIEFTMRAAQNNIPLVFEPAAAAAHLPSRNAPKDLFNHAFSHGKSSLKGDPDFIFEKDVPKITKNWFLTILFSPALSVYVIVKMLIVEKLPFRYWHTLPLIFIMKIVWCFGLAHQLKSRKAKL